MANIGERDQTVYGYIYFDTSNGAIYYLMDGTLRHIPNAQTYSNLTGNSSWDPSVFTNFDSRNGYPYYVGAPIVDDAKIVQYPKGGSALYLQDIIFDGGPLVLRLISDYNVFSWYMFSTKNMIPYDNAKAPQIGPEIVLYSNSNDITAAVSGDRITSCFKQIYSALYPELFRGILCRPGDILIGYDIYNPPQISFAQTPENITTFIASIDVRFKGYNVPLDVDLPLELILQVMTSGNALCFEIVSVNVIKQHDELVNWAINQLVYILNHLLLLQLSLPALAIKGLNISTPSPWVNNNSLLCVAMAVDDAQPNPDVRLNSANKFFTIRANTKTIQGLLNTRFPLAKDPSFNWSVFSGSANIEASNPQIEGGVDPNGKMNISVQLTAAATLKVHLYLFSFNIGVKAGATVHRTIEPIVTNDNRVLIKVPSFDPPIFSVSFTGVPSIINYLLAGLRIAMGGFLTTYANELLAAIDLFGIGIPLLNLNNQMPSLIYGTQNKIQLTPCDVIVGSENNDLLIQFDVEAVKEPIENKVVVVPK
jgi:hypothetical protein